MPAAANERSSRAPEDEACRRHRQSQSRGRTGPWLEWTGRWHAPAFVLLAIAAKGVLEPENIDFAILGNEDLTAQR